MEYQIFNQFVIENLSIMISNILIAFIISMLITPWIGRLAKFLKVFDLPKNLRSSSERGYSTRIHKDAYIKLGGLSVVITMVIITTILIVSGRVDTQIVSSPMFFFVAIGAFVIIILGYIDDKYEIPSVVQFLMQIIAAASVVFAGLSIKNIFFLGININLSWFNFQFNLLNAPIEFIFPGSIITILWVVGLINVVNWVGGIDALNASLSSVSFAALIILALSTGQITIAILVSLYLGALLGVLPYNYNPGKIMYGSIGDYMNGYFLAVFAILASTRWSITFIILAIPILDGLYVFYQRFKNNPKIRKNPMKVLTLSGKEHLHHRLLDAGFSQKGVVLFEVGLKILITSIVIFFTDIRLEYLGFLISIAIFLIALSSIAFLKNKSNRKQRLKSLILSDTELTTNPKIEANEKLIFKEVDDSDQEKFIY
jgi:UDP-GlcNAc:undecaprenyl-phosphate GlcNAc-1-phosphate transferase